MKTSEVLACAAEWIEAVGWTQGDYERDGSVCAVGALAAVHGDYTNDARSCLFRALGRAVACWNDDPERTAAEVVATLRKVARQEAKAGR